VAVEPEEELAVGRRQAVPDLLDLGQRGAALAGERGLGKSCRDADAQRAGDQLQQRPAAGGLQGVEPAFDQPLDLGPGRAASPIR